jgi:hypothetical protein
VCHPLTISNGSSSFFSARSVRPPPFLTPLSAAISICRSGPRTTILPPLSSFLTIHRCTAVDSPSPVPVCVCTRFSPLFQTRFSTILDLADYLLPSLLLCRFRRFCSKTRHFTYSEGKKRIKFKAGECRVTAPAIYCTSKQRWDRLAQSRYGVRDSSCRAWANSKTLPTERSETYLHVSHSSFEPASARSSFLPLCRSVAGSTPHSLHRTHYFPSAPFKFFLCPFGSAPFSFMGMPVRIPARSLTCPPAPRRDFVLWTKPPSLPFFSHFLSVFLTLASALPPPPLIVRIFYEYRAPLVLFGLSLPNLCSKYRLQDHCCRYDCRVPFATCSIIKCQKSSSHAICICEPFASVEKVIMQLHSFLHYRCSTASN